MDRRALMRERSLIIVKPDAMARGLAGAIIGRLQGLGLKLVALRMLELDKAKARQHYAVHEGKPFFDSVVDYISSTPVVTAVFEGEGAIDIIRKAMGPTDPTRAEKGTIRGDFGLDIEKNAIHGSDSPETAAREIALFFKEDEILDY
jgi:nucleoside-diphosphate kinase